MTEEILQQKDKELEILHQIAYYISSDLQLDDILRNIVEIASSLTSADSCMIYIYDRKKKELILKASMNPDPKIMGKIRLKIGEGVTGWVAKEKQPVVLTNESYNDTRFKSFTQLPEDKYEALLSVPILTKNEITGVINIRHRHSHEYPEYQVNLLFTVAKYLGSAVQNAISSDEVRRKGEQLDILSKISNTITSTNYLNEILHLIVAMTAQVMKSKICSIMLYNEKENELVIAATQSLSDEYKNKPGLKVGQSVSGKVVQEKKPITVTDVTKDTDYMYPEIARKENIISMLAVPMLIKDRVIGVINSYTEEEHRFTAEEISILQAIANQSAIAIENTRLNNEVFKAKEELETRKLLEKAKGMLMKEQNVSEEEAYRKMQKKSMDLRKSMKELAEAIIMTYEMNDNNRQFK